MHPANPPGYAPVPCQLITAREYTKNHSNVIMVDGIHGSQVVCRYALCFSAVQQPRRITAGPYTIRVVVIRDDTESRDSGGNQTFWRPSKGGATPPQEEPHYHSHNSFCVIPLVLWLPAVKAHLEVLVMKSFAI